MAACGDTGSQSAPPAPPPAQTAQEPSTEEELQVSTTGWETDFSRHTVPLGEFRSGGPPKDGIPSIDEPVFETIAEAGRWLEPQEPVIELELDGEARAYPIAILVWHEIVNDVVAARPVAVTFCPLCNTALAFDRRLEGRVLDFGTTGNLRNSDLVMYDRQTESWWQQFGGEAVVGELAGMRLVQLPARIVAWEDFAGRHAEGRVLSRETGHDRPYGRNPYIGYDDVDSPPFLFGKPVEDDRLPPKERVVFIERGEDAVAVPFPLLEAAGSLELDVGGQSLTVRFVPGVASPLDEVDVDDGRIVGSAEVTTKTGEPVHFDTPFWFAVAAFRPDVRIVTGA